MSSIVIDFPARRLALAHPAGWRPGWLPVGPDGQCYQLTPAKFGIWGQCGDDAGGKTIEEWTVVSTDDRLDAGPEVYGSADEAAAAAEQRELATA